MMILLCIILGHQWSHLDGFMSDNTTLDIYRCRRCGSVTIE